jgi:diaminopimelate decarboxylase
MAFHKKNGWLYCEKLLVKDIQRNLEQSPFYLYSADQVRKNYKEYETALYGIPSKISYAAKANGNLTILKLLHDLGSWVTLVSENELKLALQVGFEPDQMIFNGNGKTISELCLAGDLGIFINIDSLFDLNHIYHVSQEIRKKIAVFLRLNPGVDPKVHPYIATGQLQSKFGLPLNQVPRVLDLLSKMPSLTLVGIHSHLGSAIDDIKIFHQTMLVMARHYEQLRGAGFPVHYLNIGGGLGIDYEHYKDSFPTPADLVETIKNILPENTTLVLEPGRSIIGNAGILVCKVIGVKKTDEKNFIVTDGSMAELIRPSLYQAYHKIEYIEPITKTLDVFDIVGPVCESGDFLGKNRKLASPPEGTGIAVFDTGAYGYSMASNYNARNRPAEYMVDGTQLVQIRRAESFEDQLRFFDTD